MSEKYDVVIIGAGIGGLTCGCYLAKAGLKVLIVEQHNKPGGCCTSFERQGYRFDVGVHYFGGVNKGIFGNILSELDIRNKIRFVQFDPSDTIILPENTTHIRINPHDTINEFKKSFPKEKRKIDKFFNFIMEEDINQIYKKSRGLTFKDILDRFFEDFKIKATLGVLAGNIGTSPDKAAAFPSIVLFRQYELDPGYYPEGGIQVIPDTLARIFKENKGDLFLSRKAERIIISNDEVNGVMLDGGEKIGANIVVSNVDASQTYNNLLHMPTKESRVLKILIASPSIFSIYLGLSANFNNAYLTDHNIYYFSSYNVNRAYSRIEENILSKKVKWIGCAFPSSHGFVNGNVKKSMTIFTFAPYKTPSFWDEHRQVTAEKILEKAEELFPGLRDSIAFEIHATPKTYSKHTFNKDGAFGGWQSTTKQMNSSLMPQRSSVKKLYLAGHWCTLGYLPFAGIPNVAFSGRRAANLILEDIGKDWEYEQSSF